MWPAYDAIEGDNRSDQHPPPRLQLAAQRTELSIVDLPLLYQQLPQAAVLAEPADGQREAGPVVVAAAQAVAQLLVAARLDGGRARRRRVARQPRVQQALVRSQAFPGTRYTSPRILTERQ